jgi:hypothetical protein
LRRALGDARRGDCSLQDESRRRCQDETAQLANHGSSGCIFDFQLAPELRMICPRGLVKRARLEALNASRGLSGDPDTELTPAGRGLMLTPIATQIK